jgi:hypothetical protein
MKDFSFKHSPGRIDGLRVIANIGQKGSVQKLQEIIPSGRSFRWLSGASVVVSGSVSMRFPDGFELILRRGDYVPSIVRQSGDFIQEALDDDTLFYCFQRASPSPMWSRGFVLKPSEALELPARRQAARCILVSGRARCNDVLDLSAELEPHILRVSPHKDVRIVGEGVLLYMFEPEDSSEADPAEDGNPFVDDYVKGVFLNRA